MEHGFTKLPKKETKFSFFQKWKDTILFFYKVNEIRYAAMHRIEMDSLTPYAVFRNGKISAYTTGKGGGKNYYKRNFFLFESNSEKLKMKSLTVSLSFLFLEIFLL